MAVCNEIKTKAQTLYGAQYETHSQWLHHAFYSLGSMGAYFLSVSVRMCLNSVNLSEHIAYLSMIFFI